MESSIELHQMTTSSREYDFIYETFIKFKNLYSKLNKLYPSTKYFENQEEICDRLCKKAMNQRKIRIPIFGAYNTGKTSFINILIGKNILPAQAVECTKTVIIIRHHDLETPILSEAKFRDIDNESYWVFDEVKILAEGEKVVKEKLSKLNDEHQEKIQFLILKIKVKFFESNGKIFKNYVEFIDLPGLDSKHTIYQHELMHPLINFSDMFIFLLEKSSLLDDNDTQEILSRMSTFIKDRKNVYDISTSLFIVNKVDKFNENIDESRVKNKIAELFRDDDQSNCKNTINIIKLIKLSCKLYNDAYEICYHFKKYIENCYENFEKLHPERIINDYDRSFLKYMNDLYCKKLNKMTSNHIFNDTVWLGEESLMQKLAEYSEKSANPEFYNFNQQHYDELIQNFGKANFENEIKFRQSNISNSKQNLLEQINILKGKITQEFKKDLNDSFLISNLIFKGIDRDMSDQKDGKYNEVQTLKYLSDDYGTNIQNTRKLINQLIPQAIEEIKNGFDQLDKTNEMDMNEAIEEYKTLVENKVKDIQDRTKCLMSRFRQRIEEIDQGYFKILKNSPFNRYEYISPFQIGESAFNSINGKIENFGAGIKGICKFFLYNPLSIIISSVPILLTSGLNISKNFYSYIKNKLKKRELIEDCQINLLFPAISKLETLKRKCDQIIRDHENRINKFNNQIETLKIDYGKIREKEIEFRKLSDEYELIKREIEEF